MVTKLRQVDVLTPQGQGLAEAIRSIWVSEVTDNRWRREFGLKSDQIKRLKELETASSRLRRLCIAHVRRMCTLQSAYLRGARTASLDAAQDPARP